MVTLPLIKCWPNWQNRPTRLAISSLENLPFSAEPQKFFNRRGQKMRERDNSVNPSPQALLQPPPVAIGVSLLIQTLEQEMRQRTR
jgi:hypothetical protein